MPWLRQRVGFSFQDLAAALVSIVLSIGVIVIAINGKPIPAELSTTLGFMGGWLFTRSAHEAGRDDAVRDHNGT